MEREPTKQVNWRLPASLVEELQSVVEQTGETQTQIVREGIQQKVARKKRQIERQREKLETVTA